MDCVENGFSATVFNPVKDIYYPDFLPREVLGQSVAREQSQQANQCRKWRIW